MRGTLIVAALLFGACASTTPDIATLTSNSDQLIFETGQKAFEKKSWEVARQHFRRIIDGFPQSEYVPASRLALADSYFKEGGTANDILAVSAYREFLTFYPSHPKSDYAQYQVGESYFDHRNGPDRDQTPTHHALEEFRKVLEIYPGSPYAEPARKRIGECRQSLARAEFLAGYFYQRTRQACRSAIPRYETALREYTDYERLDEVLFRISQCLESSGRAQEALPHLSRLLEDYPTSEYAAEARSLRERLKDVVSPPMPPPAGEPAATPSPEPSPVNP